MYIIIGNIIIINILYLIFKTSNQLYNSARALRYSCYIMHAVLYSQGRRIKNVHATANLSKNVVQAFYPARFIFQNYQLYGYVLHAPERISQFNSI